jgi:hypothetical protein
MPLISSNYQAEPRFLIDSLCTHFEELFTSSHPSLSDELLNLFENTISTEENLSICSMPSEQGIHESVFSIGGTKAPGPDGFTGFF